MHDFLSLFLGNQHRARILRTLVANDSEALGISTLAKRSGMSPSIVRRELRSLAKMKLVRPVKRLVVAEGKKTKGRRSEECWELNHEHVFVQSVARFVKDVSPTQFQEVERALKGAGKMSTIVLSGLFVGDHTCPADLIIAGEGVNERRLERVVRSLEPKFGREIRYTLFSTPEFRYRLTVQDRLLRDVLDFPHRVLMNKAGIL